MPRDGDRPDGLPIYSSQYSSAFSFDLGGLPLWLIIAIVSHRYCLQFAFVALQVCMTGKASTPNPTSYPHLFTLALQVSNLAPVIEQYF